MENYDPEDFDEKEVYMEEEDAAVLLLSDQLMEEDDESEIYEMMEDEDDDEMIVGTPQPQYSDEIDASFCEEEDSLINDEGLVQENPFEPVYPAAGGLLFDADEKEPAGTEKGMVLEAVSLDNILPAGSRRRRA